MARYVVSKAAGISGPPIPADEPCLVIRAQDLLAHTMLRKYIQLASECGVSQDVIDELQDHMVRLVTWRRDNSSKLKLADR